MNISTWHLISAITHVKAATHSFLSILSECVLILIKDANRTRSQFMWLVRAAFQNTQRTQPLHKYLAVIVHTGHDGRGCWAPPAARV